MSELNIKLMLKFFIGKTERKDLAFKLISPEVSRCNNPQSMHGAMDSRALSVSHEVWTRFISYIFQDLVAPRHD